MLVHYFELLVNGEIVQTPPRIELQFIEKLK